MTYNELTNVQLTDQELTQVSGGKVTHVIVTREGERIHVKQRDHFKGDKEYEDYIKGIEKKIGIGT
jgi:hypothetical protein